MSLLNLADGLRPRHLTYYNLLLLGVKTALLDGARGGYILSAARRQGTVLRASSKVGIEHCGSVTGVAVAHLLKT